MFNSATTSLLLSVVDKLDGLHRKLSCVESQQLGLDYKGNLEVVALRLRKQVATLSEKFTICVVGEFKVGKSTVLNGLLGLYGDAALAAADSLDTACSVMLRFRGSGDPEALLVFDKKANLPDRQVTWHEAKRYTSQVYRNADPSLDKEARSLEQVDYFVQSSVLEDVNLNDLPGTGSIYWREHTAKAEESIRTADAILWVIFDQEPGADGTRFLDIVAKQDRQVIPVVNIRQEEGETPELEIAEEVASQVRRRYRQHFEVGISSPLLYSARVVEVERMKPVPDTAVLENAGYLSLVEHLLSSDAATRRTQAKETRIYGACRDLFTEASRAIRAQLDFVLVRRSELEATCKTFAEQIAKLDDVHDHVEAELRLLGEAYSTTACNVIGEVCGRFIDENLTATNWEAVLTLLKNSREELSRQYAKKFRDKYFLDEPRLPAIGRKYERNAIQVLRKEWRSQGWAGEPESPTMPSKNFAPAEGNDLEDALAIGLAKAAATAILIALVVVFQPFIIAAMPLAFFTTRNPMAKMRDEAKQRARREIHRWRINLEDAFVESWTSESRRIESELRDGLGANENTTTKDVSLLAGLSTKMEDAATAIEHAASKLHAEQTGRSEGA